ncbi:MAG: nuclear transport factor 2 family protein [Pseudomonadaceae bacterium]|nr:nuclear transport factor 2 family protein [Pseudomonadaceae bacterium]
MSEVAVADNQQAVLDLVSAFNRIDVDGVMRCLHPEAVYHNMPVDPVSGERSIRAVIESFTSAASEINWEMVNVSITAEGHVMTERLDRFKINNRWITLPVMGIFEVTDGLITCWRDYFDMEQFQSQLKATQS